MTGVDEAKRIAFIVGSMGKGGAERVVSILANHYKAKGWIVDILMLLGDECAYDLDERINLVSIFDKNKPRLLQVPIWISGIREYVIKHNPYRIVSFIARINLIVLIACLGLNQWVIISERNDPKSDGRSFFVKLLTYILYPFSKSIVFQTMWAKSCFPARVQQKGVIICNPINVTTRALDKKQKKIVSVGRLAEQKNHSMLIEAFAQVLKRHPGYTLFIYGEGELRHKLEQKVVDLNLCGQVILPGTVSNIHEMISDAEIFVLSSNYEGMSNALLEAMMMGLPCIATDCSGTCEILVHEKNGLLVPVGNTAKLIEAIDKLLSDKELALRLGDAARIAAQNFASDEVLKKWDLIIENSID